MANDTVYTVMNQLSAGGLYSHSSAHNSVYTANTQSHVDCTLTLLIGVTHYKCIVPALSTLSNTICISEALYSNVLCIIIHILVLVPPVIVSFLFRALPHCTQHPLCV